MNYTEYCESQDFYEIFPSINGSLFSDLDDIAMKYPTVLHEIQQMSFKSMSKLNTAVTRGADILLSTFGLFISVIPFLLISMAIKIDSPGPVFFRQKRVRKGGEIFQILKFRTMCVDAERGTGPIWATPDDPRRTVVGTFLRRTRLDELPNLLNILKGEMTFIGPRPERPEFVYQFVKFMPAFDRRHEAKPGLTGLAQLKNGYDDSAQSVYRKLRWDAYYLRKKCFRLDLSLLYRTVFAVLRGEV